MKNITEEQFQVEKILKKRVSSKGVVSYYVKWLNYSEKQSTWEGIDNLANSEDLIAEFQSKPSKKITKTKRIKNSKNELRVVREQIIPEKQPKYIQISDDSAQELFNIDPPQYVPKPYNIEDMAPIPYENVETLSVSKSSKKLVASTSSSSKSTPSKIQPATAAPAPTTTSLQHKKKIQAKHEKQKLHYAHKIVILKPAVQDGINKIKYQLNGRKYISDYRVIKKYCPLQLLQFYEKHFHFYQNRTGFEQKI